MTAPKVGDVVERDGDLWRVTDVMPRLTPYRRANQDTRVEGYTLGLKRCFIQINELAGPWDPNILPEL